MQVSCVRQAGLEASLRYRKLDKMDVLPDPGEFHYVFNELEMPVPNDTYLM